MSTPRLSTRLIPLAAVLLLLMAGCTSPPKQVGHTRSETIDLHPRPTPAPIASPTSSINSPAPPAPLPPAPLQPNATTTAPPQEASRDAAPAQPVRSWGTPLELGTRQGGAWEPAIFTQPNGTVYVATAGPVYRYVEGSIFEDIVPEELWGASSAAFSIAPNGTLWYTTPSYMLGVTATCRSTTQGTTWACNPVSMPVDVDRVWIQGTGTNTSILQTSHGLQATWHTTSDGGNYTPYATTPSPLGSRTGNMVYDASRDTFWQLQTAGLQLQGDLKNVLRAGTMQLLRIDNQTGLVSATDTKLPVPYALPWLSIDNGTLWTTTETRAANGSLSVVVARSRDGATWEIFPISHLPKTATLSSVAVRGNRAAVAYYGANDTGAPNEITTDWNYYVAETSNAQDPRPTWTERVVAPGLRHGSLCIGGCDLIGRIIGGDEPGSNFARSFQGIAMDSDGNIHLGFVRDQGYDQFSLYYTRQLFHE